MRKTCGVRAVTVIWATGTMPPGVVNTTSAGAKVPALMAVLKVSSTALTFPATGMEGVMASTAGTRLLT